MRLLNLGCGDNVHPEWVNMDAVALVPGVCVHDARRGFPFPTGTFDAVYSSHVIEHFTRGDARTVLRECGSILKPRGVLRVVVPDMEEIARAYLLALDDVVRGVKGADARHEWMMLELVDQLARERGGGEMLEAIRATPPGQLAFITERIGVSVVEVARQAPINGSLRRARRGLLHWAWCCGNIIREPKRLRELVLKRLLGTEYDALEVGRFRRCGEVHRWMYDYPSLAALLQDCGFTAVRRVSYSESRIAAWERYALDGNANDGPRKPHSLYVECERAS